MENKNNNKKNNASNSLVFGRWPQTITAHENEHLSGLLLLVTAAKVTNNQAHLRQFFCNFEVNECLSMWKSEKTCSKSCFWKKKATKRKKINQKMATSEKRENNIPKNIFRWQISKRSVGVEFREKAGGVFRSGFNRLPCRCRSWSRFRRRRLRIGGRTSSAWRRPRGCGIYSWTEIWKRVNSLI